jgi:hypothetical protein
LIYLTLKVLARMKQLRIPDMRLRIQLPQMNNDKTSIFEERYRVVAVEGDRLLMRGILSGEVLTIINPEPETPLRQEDYPPGTLIALTDPSTAPLN